MGELRVESQLWRVVAGFVGVAGALEGTVAESAGTGAVWLAMGTKKPLSRVARVFCTMNHIHTHQRMPPARKAPPNRAGQNSGLRFC